MLRPVIDNQDEAREHLDDIMEETAYPYRHYHHRIMDHAFIVSIVDTETSTLAGYFWFYRLQEDETHYSIHLLVLPSYKKKFFSRTLVNACLNLMWILGCDTVVAENANHELLLRVGGYMNNEDEAMLTLPHEWR
jgi:GNAT superfamily N-acetyltransferase